MYKWYHDSAICYVYLSDVPCRILDSTRQEVPADSFLSSRWFTRGWTFQELLAPRVLVFFSADGEKIGDRNVFSDGIARQTQIPRNVIENSRKAWIFNAESVIRWTLHRKTKREEDAAYSLLGVLGVQMPLIYGEGKTRAFTRLRNEIDHSRFQRRLHSVAAPRMLELAGKTAVWQQ